MFPENAITKKYDCVHTKISAIISELAGRSQKKLVDSLEEQAFLLVTDDTNNTDSKIYPVFVAVKYYQHY